MYLILEMTENLQRLAGKNGKVNHLDLGSQVMFIYSTCKVKNSQKVNTPEYLYM